MAVNILSSTACGGVDGSLQAAKQMIKLITENTFFINAFFGLGYILIFILSKSSIKIRHKKRGSSCCLV
jgi:hypothetical protein